MKPRFFLFASAFMMFLLPCSAQKVGLVKDEGGVTNVRKGPGIKYPVVSTIDDGSIISFGETRNGWCKVWYFSSGSDPLTDEAIGYMAASKIVVPKKTGESRELGVVLDEGGYTNIRKGPGSKYSVLCKVKDGSFILYHPDENAQWIKVYNQNGTFKGYIHQSKLTVIESPSF